MGHRPGAKESNNLDEYFFSHDLSKLEAEPFCPLLDLAETPGEVIVRIELPGVGEADIHVSIAGRWLRIEGAKREPDFLSREAVRFLLLERAYGSFRKQVELRWVIDPKDVTAELADGILTITLPKQPDRRGTVFEIPVRCRSKE